MGEDAVAPVAVGFIYTAGVHVSPCACGGGTPLADGPYYPGGDPPGQGSNRGVGFFLICNRCGTRAAFRPHYGDREQDITWVCTSIEQWAPAQPNTA